MDILLPCGKLVSHDVNSSVNARQYNQKPGRDSLVDDLGSSFNEFLHIQDVKKSPSTTSISLSEGDTTSHLENTKISEDHKTHQTKSQIALPQKSLCKSATFPITEKLSSSAATTVGDEKTVADSQGNNTAESMNSAYLRSISLPTPLKLVSAMKGGREKEGIKLTKVNVTWAPDVYDPPTTSVSHSVKSNSNQRSKNSKKNGKSRQKGKSSRGSKDKKQLRKVSGSSVSYKMLEASDRMLLKSYADPHAEIRSFEDFHFADEDSNCASSFLRASVTKVHYSVAEAT